MHWREIRQFTMWFVLLAGVVGSGLAAFKYNYNISHDLSVIGKGVPTIVQIHDPNCPLCNQLRRNADAAAEKLGDHISPIFQQRSGGACKDSTMCHT